MKIQVYMLGDKLVCKECGSALLVDHDRDHALHPLVQPGTPCRFEGKTVALPVLKLEVVGAPCGLNRWERMHGHKI